MIGLKDFILDVYGISNYHVVDYDEEIGEVLYKATCQGISDNLAWLRRQVWAIYGYTMAYRET